MNRNREILGEVACATRKSGHLFQETLVERVGVCKRKIIGIDVLFYIPQKIHSSMNTRPKGMIQTIRSNVIFEKVRKKRVNNRKIKIIMGNLGRDSHGASSIYDTIYILTPE